jgi:hypothetical protein
LQLKLLLKKGASRPMGQFRRRTGPRQQVRWPLSLDGTWWQEGAIVEGEGVVSRLRPRPRGALGRRKVGQAQGGDFPTENEGGARWVWQSTASQSSRLDQSRYWWAEVRGLHGGSMSSNMRRPELLP